MPWYARWQYEGTCLVTACAIGDAVAETLEDVRRECEKRLGALRAWAGRGAPPVCAVEIRRDGVVLSRGRVNGDEIEWEEEPCRNDSH